MGVDEDERDRREAVAGLAMEALEGDDRWLAADAVAAVSDVLAGLRRSLSPVRTGRTPRGGFDDAKGFAERALAGEEGAATVVGPAGEPRGVLCVGSGMLSEAEFEFLKDIATVLDRAWGGGKFRQFAERLEEVIWMNSVEIDEITTSTRPTRRSGGGAGKASTRNRCRSWRASIRVCDRLAEAYRFVWIGGVAPGGTRVISRVSAGVEEGYLDAIRITADEADTAAGPAGRAIETGEVQVAADIAEDPSFEPWREEALERGYRSGVSVPITTRDYSTGCSTSTRAGRTRFPARGSTRSRDWATSSATRSRPSSARRPSRARPASSSSSAPRAFPSHSWPARGSPAAEHLSRQDDRLIAYGTAISVPEDRLREAVEREVDLVSFRILDREDGSYGFELKTAGALSLVGTLAGYGGRLSLTIADGDCRFAVELPKGADT